MNQLTLLFTKSPWSLTSWLIRWALPRSRFAFALSSHVLVFDGRYAYSVDLFTGVTRTPAREAMRGRVLVKEVHFEVPSLSAAIDFLELQVGKKYDLKGAMGIGLNPDRDWNEPNKWFCYELAAAALQAGGRDVFSRLTHVTETALLSLKA